MGYPTKDETGNVYGKLKVIKLSGNESKRKLKKWICECECGNTTEVLGSNLRNKGTKSCGCIRKDNDSHFKKGGFGKITGAYWSILRSRFKPEDKDRQITLEYIWNLFLKQNGKCALSGIDIELVSRYAKNYSGQTASLDRIDSSKGYIIGNVQWTHKTVNIIKWSLSQEEFLNFCRLVADNTRSKYNMNEQ